MFHSKYVNSICQTIYELMEMAKRSTAYYVTSVKIELFFAVLLPTRSSYNVLVQITSLIIISQSLKKLLGNLVDLST